MKSFFQTLSLFVLLLVGTSVTAQMAHKDQMASKGDAMTAKQEATMAAKPTPTLIHLDQVAGEYTTQQLNLTPGEYIFEVTNTEVDKGLGFYLQNAKGEQVANSGLAKLVGNGETSRTGVVTLTEGSFQYSCPLNPTPHYNISVGAPKTIVLTQNEGVYNEGNLELAPGYYVFEVTNTEVDKGLGFYLQDGEGAQVKDSGLKALVGKGQTNTSGVVFLAPGTYQYSCPLNPTPHYTVTVK